MITVHNSRLAFIGWLSSPQLVSHWVPTGQPLCLDFLPPKMAWLVQSCWSKYHWHWLPWGDTPQRPHQPLPGPAAQQVQLGLNGHETEVGSIVPFWSDNCLITILPINHSVIRWLCLVCSRAVNASIPCIYIHRSHVYATLQQLQELWAMVVYFSTVPTHANNTALYCTLTRDFVKGHAIAYSSLYHRLEFLLRRVGSRFPGWMALQVIPTLANRRLTSSAKRMLHSLEAP